MSTLLQGESQLSWQGRHPTSLLLPLSSEGIALAVVAVGKGEKSGLP